MASAAYWINADSFSLWSAGFKQSVASVQFLVGTGPCSKTTTHVGTIPKQLVLCGQKWDKTGGKGARGQEAGALPRPPQKVLKSAYM